MQIALKPLAQSPALPGNAIQQHPHYAGALGAELEGASGGISARCQLLGTCPIRHPPTWPNPNRVATARPGL